MYSFTHTLEEQPKQEILHRLDALKTEGVIDAVTHAALTAITKTLSGKLVSLNFNGSKEQSGYLYSSWHSHDDDRDVPNDEERMIPNEPGFEIIRDKDGKEIDRKWHEEWKGQRVAKMKQRLGREPRL